MTRYKNRREAGRRLAASLSVYETSPGTVVLALPRGGVEVGYEVAVALHAPLDVFIVRKLGVPAHPELAMGAIATGNVTVFNQSVISTLQISEMEVASVIERERGELMRREKLFRESGEPVPLKDRVVIVVDDGLATGASMRAAIQAVRQKEPKWLVAAVPVGAPGICRDIEVECDELVCLCRPDPFEAVGLWYDDFRQTPDGEVRRLLGKANELASRPVKKESQLNGK